MFDAFGVFGVFVFQEKINGPGGTFNKPAKFLTSLFRGLSISEIP